MLQQEANSMAKYLSVVRYSKLYVLLVIVDLHIPPCKGFIGPGLVQFEDLEKHSCKTIIVKHGISTGPHLL